MLQDFFTIARSEEEKDFLESLLEEEAITPSDLQNILWYFMPPKLISPRVCLDLELSVVAADLVKPR